MELERSYYGSPKWSWEILDCAMPMTFDTYSNCAHQCVYCFAYFQRAVGDSANDYLHHKVKAVNVDKVKRMFTDPDEHAGQFAWYIKQKRVMQWGGLSDAFDWYERKFRKSLELLRFFVDQKYPVSISTKGVWWLYEPEYRELLEEGAANGTIHLKITVITDSAAEAKLLEAGTPTPSERFDGLEEAAKMGVVTTLRFRPYILGVSDKCDVQMIQRAKSVGCYSVTTEFLCIEGRSSSVADERYKQMSKVAGYDVYRFYRMNSSARSGLLRLNYDLKRPHMERMREAAEAIDLPFFVSDAHHKESGCTSGCCGLPTEGPLGNSFDGHFGEAVQIAKKNGIVFWSDIADEAENLKKISFYRAEGYNAGSTRARAKRRYQTMYDYMRETWNDVDSKLSPARHHGGAMVPAGEDENGDIIYVFNRKWVDDGERVGSVAELLETGRANDQLDRLYIELKEREPEEVPDVGKPMRVFIPTKDRPDAMTTHKLFEGADVTVVVHNDEQRQQYEDAGIDPGLIVVSDVRTDIYGKARQKRFIFNELCEPGEWVILADDNIKRLTAVNGKHYDQEKLKVQDGRSDYWREVYGEDIDAERMMVIANECRRKAEGIGAHMVGFALVDNYYFRGKKWTDHGYTIAKLLIQQQTDLPIVIENTLDDHTETSEHLLRYGAVLINRFLYPIAGHYEVGGHGTYEKRGPQRQKDVKVLMKNYPGLWKVKQRTGFLPDSDVQFGLRGRKAVERWRAQMGVSTTGG